jgi:signal transduction histidine kinase
MPTELRRKRLRSIRVLLTLIFIVPLASLLGLWGFAASVTVSNAIQEHNFNNENRLYGGSAQALFTQLAQERLQAYEWLSSGGRVPGEAQLLAQQRATDVAASALMKGLHANSSHIVSSAWPAVRNFSKQLAWLSGSHGIRRYVDSRGIPALTAFSDYNTIIDAEFYLYGDLVVVNNTPLYVQALASVQAGRAVEMASREASLITGTLFTGGQMSKSARTLFAQTVATRQLLMTDALRQLNRSCGSGYRRAEASAAHRSFTSIENQIIGSIGSKGPVRIDAAAFGAAVVPLFNEYQAAEGQDRTALSSLGTRVGDQLLEEVALAGGAGLLAVALSVFLMLGFGRRISRELTGLQHAALELAEDRLPRVVSRLSAGEDVDVAAEAAPITGGRIAETARVAEAFSSVQRTAVEAAVGQAKLRRGVSQVFRNLAWRSQSLLHRQLALLDAMERRQTEPERLDELFQLDHLTTRMRRHAEGLVILSGATPGRGWREPVPVMDVVRGAIAEIEDYKRVTVLCDSYDAIAGTAVADVIHLLAELIENATTFSPASNEVTVRAERVANGFVVEIEDRGIGIGARELVALNERLASPPEFDLADSEQLGLFVVARLANKHHITVTLRRSPYGGTAAIVLLPNSIVAVRDDEDAGAFGMFGNEVAGNGRPLPAVWGTALPGVDAAAGAVVAGSDAPGDSDGGARNGAGRDGGRAIAAEQSPGLAGHRLAPYLPADEDPEPAVTSPGDGAEDLVVAGSAEAAREASPAAGGGIGGDADSGGGALDGSWTPADRLRGGTAGWFWDREGATLAQDDASAGAYTPGQHEAPSAWDRNAPGSARDVDPVIPAPEVNEPTPAQDRGHDPFVSPPSTAPPALPRRQRQASLAPQLRSGNQAAGVQADSQDNLSPADSRALVESLQYGLERAATTAMPADGPWPAEGSIEPTVTGEDSEDP